MLLFFFLFPWCIKLFVSYFSVSLNLKKNCFFWACFYFSFFSHHDNYSLFTYLVACLLAGWLSLLLTMTRCWPLSLFDWLSRDRAWEYFVRSSKEMLRKTENSKIDSSSKKKSSRVKLIKTLWSIWKDISSALPTCDSSSSR